eukprot:754329-Hanusia_phi.AAC.1
MLNDKLPWATDGSPARRSQTSQLEEAGEDRRRGGGGGGRGGRSIGEILSLPVDDDTRLQVKSTKL